MITLTLTLDSLATYIVAIDIIVLLLYILYIFQKNRALEKSIKNITDFISEYFTHTGADVRVTCFKLDGYKRFVTLIESQPLKRFRYSNVLENNLISHIYQKTGNTVEKIYWRFPVEIHKDEVLAEAQAEVIGDDSYFVDIQAAADAGTTYKVSEASWDEFKSTK
ncbi:MAG TPA: hypothetical protein VIO39_04010 [Methylotenera sp.]